MKQLILLKQSTSIQLAHLYEHLFCSQLDTFLRNRNLYQELDYRITGKTYHGGIVSVQVDLCTDQATKLIRDIPAISIKNDLESFLVAVNQILAEKQEPIGATSHDAILQALGQIQAQPWITIDEFEQVDTKGIRRQPGAFYIAEGKPVISKKLYVNLTLDEEIITNRRDLLPLFQQMSRFMMSNIISDLSDTYGYYSVDDAFKLQTDSATYSNMFRTGEADVQLKENVEIILKLISEMRSDAAFERFASQLSDVSYLEWQTVLPDFEKIYEDTLVFIGSKGWQEIATPENCELLLKHIAVTLKFGKKEIVSALIGVQ
jgi:hypothetical protein